MNLTAAARAEVWLPVGEVAKALRYAPRTIRKRCALGQIPARQLGPYAHWVIPRSWLDEQLRERGTVVRRPAGGV